MKPVAWLSFLLVSLVLSGCGKKDNPPPPAPKVSATPAPAPAGDGGYVGAMLKAQQSAIKTVDLASLNNAIQQFNVTEGRNPKDLDELVSTHYMPRIPAAPVGMKLVYDEKEGKVTTASQQ
jgi:hypothetical protein